MSNIWVLDKSNVTEIREIKLVERELHAEKDDAATSRVICYIYAIEAVPVSGADPLILFETKMIDQLILAKTDGSDLSEAEIFWESKFRFVITSKDREYTLVKTDDKRIFMTKIFTRIVQQINLGKEHIIDRLALGLETAHELINKRKDR
jgi:hypothetical protein